ncbi:MAG: lipid-A-disaccharide synthase [Pirellulaceae bacterium]|nr:lipid-A-disaccharide synthase [Pirellulaceae bacterium]
MNTPNLFFSVGEPSGDLHAAKLISQLQYLQPSATFQGFGGGRMSEAGCQIDYELTNLAVMGFAEVLPKLREFIRVANIASDIFARKRPDAVVLVDFPGFNWHIAERAKQHKIPVIYYLPPQLWAWGGWRIAKMRRNVDHVICNLPFEPQWYAQRQMSVDYVGHPFFDEVRQRQLDAHFLAKWREYEGVQVAVLPGSRTREVKKIWPMQLAAIRELARRHPQARFMVAALHDQHCLWCSQQLTDSDRKLNIQFFVGKTSEIIELADCSLMKSGSVSLEMMARGTPSVVVYHISRGHYAIVKCVTRIKSMTLPNMIAGKIVMPEFLAVGRTGKVIAQSIVALDRLMSDRGEREKQRQELLLLSRQFAGAGEHDTTGREAHGEPTQTQSCNTANTVSRKAALSICRHLGFETEAATPRCSPALLAG